MNSVFRTEEFDRWLSKLRDGLGKGRIIHRIRALERGRAGDCKSLGNGVWELRIHVGPGYRVYFTRVSESTLILLCGGKKGAQRRDISLARRLALEYELD